MNEEIIGIEVGGEIHAIKDEETSGKTETLEQKVSVAEQNIENLEQTATEQTEKLTQIETNIGETDIQELKSLVDSHEEEMKEVSEELPKITATLETLLFSKLQLLKKGENGNYITQWNETDDVDFDIQNWDSYAGVVLVHSQYRQGTGIGVDRAKNIREIKTFLKKTDGSLRANLYSTTHGERMVVNSHEFSVDPLGRATLHAGYSPKEDVDSESDTHQSIIPVFEIYGILKD